MRSSIPAALLLLLLSTSAHGAVAQCKTEKSAIKTIELIAPEINRIQPEIGKSLTDAIAAFDQNGEKLGWTVLRRKETMAALLESDAMKKVYVQRDAEMKKLTIAEDEGRYSVTTKDPVIICLALVKFHRSIEDVQRIFAAEAALMDTLTATMK